MVRHLNCTTFICTQHFNKVPKICRLQASFIFFFAGSAQEVEILTDMFAPPLYNKKEFAEIVNEATRGRFNFFTICMKVGWRHRFRRNLDEFIVLPRIAEDENEQSQGKPGAVQAKKPQPKSKEEEEFSADNLSAGLRSIIKLRKERDGFYEQKSKNLSGWAYKGPRGRTIW